MVTAAKGVSFMQPINDQYNKLKSEVSDAVQRIGLAQLLTELKSLQEKSKSPTFWDSPNAAQEIMQSIAKLEKRTKPWQEVDNDLVEVGQLIDLNDQNLTDELKSHLQEIERKYLDLKSELKFVGEFDDHDAILSIYAGAGGTDAQDWTQILLKMYTRWAEQNNNTVKSITESAGDEAGLKSVTIEIEGNFAYGKLKGEHGVHRLVRLSPFNANHLRETSFAKVEVLPKIDKPSDLKLDDKEIQIDVFRSGGHGGQSVNTTDSAVRVTHLPTSISVVIQNERSQLQNKEMAMTILRSKLIQLKLEQHQDNLNAIKGPNQSAEWGNQIRSYVMHPYKQVKDLRTRYETSDVDAVLRGELNPFIDAYIDSNLQA